MLSEFPCRSFCRRPAVLICQPSPTAGAAFSQSRWENAVFRVYDDLISGLQYILCMAVCII